MRNIEKADLEKILARHLDWLKGNAEGERANLSGANLSGAYLRGANLSGANLRDAYLSGAYLSGAYLSGANLSGANLRDAYLSDAYLRGANLSGAYLRDAYLSGAYLRGANLSGAYLRGANLRGANLRGANLSGAYLSGANLSGANLRGANLRGANLSGANLSGAYELDSAIMPGGFTFAVYKAEVVPALLAAGGRDPKEVAAKSWDCHQWDNCPMAEAFGVHGIDEVPPLYREQARLFVQFFDANLLPNPFEFHQADAMTYPLSGGVS
jgi:hypothetical protein